MNDITQNNSKMQQWVVIGSPVPVTDFDCMILQPSQTVWQFPANSAQSHGPKTCKPDF